MPFGIMPPVGGPDAMEFPAEVFEDHLAQLVAVAGGGSAVVGCSVALDSKQIAVGCGGINDC
ncbi:MAG: hypothetical protein RLZZ398_1906 [Verrucomicrobiota bacterium]